VQFLEWTSVRDFANTLCSNADHPIAIERSLELARGYPQVACAITRSPREYGIRGYRYTVVNDRPVLVDRSHRIVEIIE
jgi:hypothetical protein